MAWIDLQFDFGTTLTASKMNALDENFDALASDATGSPKMMGRTTKAVHFSSQGSIIASRNITSLTYTATGQYKITPSTPFSLSTQTISISNVTTREIFTLMSGFTANVAYSDESVRSLMGNRPATVDSSYETVYFRAGNKTSTAAENVYEGLVIIFD
tara:strand:+ start:175 stop:648 length:474 start_codon:yes stop_codon:yes gene_type:complete